MSPPPHHPPPPRQPHHPPIPPNHPPPPQPQPQHPPHQPQPQQHPPPQYQNYPYYPPPYPPRSKTRSSSSFASCLLATSFLIILTIAGIITCFILFRPQDPTISVNTMRFPSFSTRNSSANFTFFQHVSVRNPNRYSFSHYDSSLQLFSSSAGPLGFVYIPAGQIAGGRTQFMSATFDVKSFPVPNDATGGTVVAAAEPGSVVGPGPTMELETRMKLVGSVKVMKVFSHHVEKTAKCRVSLRVSDGSILGYNC